MRLETKKVIIALFILLGSSFPLFVSAQGLGGPGCGGDERVYADQALNSKTPDEYDTALKNYQDHSCQVVNFFTGFAKVINYLIGGIGLFVVLRLVIAGTQMVASAGNENAAKNAKVAIQSAITGLIIVFLAYLIVSTLFSIFAVRLGVDAKFTFPYNPFKQQ